MLIAWMLELQLMLINILNSLLFLQNNIALSKKQYFKPGITMFENRKIYLLHMYQGTFHQNWTTINPHKESDN